MKKAIFSVIFLLVTATSFGTESQQGKNRISGVVLSGESKAPEEYVVVYIADTNKQTLTDDQGRFSIEAKKGETIVFNKVGFNERRLPVDESHMTVYLDQNSYEIEKVVVKANKNINDIDMREVAGAITTIDFTQLANRSEMDMMKLLQGQVPGLMVTSSGELGSKPVIRLRGDSSLYTSGTANEPLFVLDGIVVSSEAFLAMNPEDFEQMKILKDAAATALYGIKAANGVIEITSKRGYQGKPSITVRAKAGITFRGPRGVEMMDSAEKLELERLLENSATPGYYYSEKFIRSKNPDAPNLNALIAAGQRALDSLRGINTDWYKELLRISSFESYSLGIRGGTEKNSYYYSLNYGRQGGRIPGNDIRRITGRVNQDYILAKLLSLSLNLGAGYSATNTPNGSDHDPGSLIYNLNPYERKTDPVTGAPGKLISYPDRTYSDLINQYSKFSTNKRFEGSAMMRWEILEGLDISAVGGADYLLKESKGIVPRDAYSQTKVPDVAKGSLSQEKGTEFNVSTNVRINYTKTLGDHDFTVSANSDSYYLSYDDMGVRGYGLPSKLNTIAGINQGLTESYRPTLSGRRHKELQVGFGGAASYSYNSTYEVYGSYKADASSLLPSDKRWNSAWAVGVGWSLGRYPIFIKAKVLTDIKIRASYGFTASMAGIDAASTVPTFNYTDNIYGEGRIFNLKALYNTLLRPQQTKSINVGADIVLFHRFTLGVDFYNNRTKDVLMDMPVAPSNGFDKMMKNIGSLSNTGVEVKLSGDVINAGKWRWNTSLSFSWNKNIVIELYGTDALYTGDSLLPDYEVGQPVGTMWGLKSLNINPMDGMPSFETPDGREITHKDKLTRDDFSVLGYSTPPYMGFFNNSISYGPFNLSFDIYFSFGGIASASYTYVRDTASVIQNAVANQTKDMWFKKGDNGKIYPTAFVPTGGYEQLAQPSTMNIYKTDFIRLNNIQFNYRMPSKALKKLGGFIKFMNFNIQAQSLYTYRPQKDKSSVMDALQPVLTFGINITF